MAEVTITVSGQVGCAKSALLGEIEIMLKSMGVPVRYSDEAAAQAEKNGTHADWTDAIEMYKPSVVLVEAISEQAKAEPTYIKDADEQGGQCAAILQAMYKAFQRGDSVERAHAAVMAIVSPAKPDPADQLFTKAERDTMKFMGLDEPAKSDLSGLTAAIADMRPPSKLIHYCSDSYIEGFAAARGQAVSLLAAITKETRA